MERRLRDRLEHPGPLHADTDHGPTAYPQEHIYTELVVRGVTLPLDADQVFRGTWRVKDNRDHLEAKLVSDQKMCFPTTCAELFVSMFSTLLPRMLYPASPPKIASIMDQESSWRSRTILCTTALRPAARM